MTTQFLYKRGILTLFRVKYPRPVRPVIDSIPIPMILHVEETLTTDDATCCEVRLSTAIPLHTVVSGTTARTFGFTCKKDNRAYQEFLTDWKNQFVPAPSMPPPQTDFRWDEAIPVVLQ